MKRPNKHEYYLNIAAAVSARGTCIRRNYGAVIVKNDEIIATGYTGSPRGMQNCIESNSCQRVQRNIKSGEHYELCKSVHAEANAIISASRKDMINSNLYLVGIDTLTGKVVENADSCLMCRRLIINAGISCVIRRISNENFLINEIKEWKNFVD